MAVGTILIWLGIAGASFLPMILCLISCLTKKVPNEEKLLWCLIIVLSSWIGQIIYLIIGRKQLKELEAKGGAA
ncbi:MAG: PLD nuclease N-terminal domain-containing protein [Defluviitaleaceae bacterium]|nr:PLD nuclease N-terminal domain-containing protein [Defluviitaleaceae bacterium]